MAHIVVFIAEFQRDKGIESTGAILQVAQPVHVIDAVCIGFDMAVQHGRVGVHAFPVRRLMDAQPAFGVDFIGAYQAPDLRMKDFRASARHRIQPCHMQPVHTFFHTEFGFPEHIVQLHRGEPFDMQTGPVGLDLLQQFGKELQVHLRVDAANDMHFGHRFAVITFHDVQHLLETELPALVPMGI